MKDKQLLDFITMKANEFKTSGVAIGEVLKDYWDTYVPRCDEYKEYWATVDQDTLFILGSVTKTFTATTLMRLVVEGKVSLYAPVRQYVPELKLADEQSAKTITDALLNHTSGLDWRVDVDSGEGDDALAREVASLPS